MSRKGTRSYRVITVALLVGILIVLIMLYNQRVTTQQTTTGKSQVQPQTEQKNLPDDEILSEAQII
jgi:hypothetical protein